MRDLFRLIAVGVMSLAVVGFAMFYSSGGSLVSAARAAGLIGPKSALETLTTTVSAAGSVAAAKTITVERPDPSLWVGLAGLPDQSEMTFPLPEGEDFASGTLDLGFDTYLPAGSQGMMAVSVNGTVRGQIVLEQGQARHEISLGLTATDLTGDELVLRFNGRHAGKANGTCPTQSAAVVTLLPESRLDLVVGDAQQSPAAEGKADAAMVPELSAGEGATISMSALGADMAVKTFRGSQKWALDFAASDLALDGLSPRLALSLMTTPLREGQDYLLRFTLNGSLVETRRLSGKGDRIAMSAELPVAALLANNRLVVELVDATPQTDACGEAEQLQAQLLPESVLVLTGAKAHAASAR